MMKSWSITQLSPERRIKLYLDTNMLMYLYTTDIQGIICAINFLNSKSAFLDLATSRYALFEFLDNRKKTHYKEYLEKEGIKVEMEEGDDVQSKYKSFNYFSVPNHSYISIYKDVTEKVQEDIDKLDGFNIEYETNVFNENLFNPTKDLCLASRISRHDCLIAVSTVFPSDGVINDNVILWTNDALFQQGFSECTEVSNIFANTNITVEHVKALLVNYQSRKKQLDLVTETRQDKIFTLLAEKIKEYIVSKNKAQFVGFTDAAVKVPNVIFIANKGNAIEKERPILTIISRNLDFIVTSSYIDSFQDNNSIVENFPINLNDVISCKWVFPGSVDEQDRQEIINELKKPGHLVFVDGYYEDY